MEPQTTQNNKSALYTLIMVFFFWGFLAASNGIFIPFCKSHFNLTQFESQLIDSAFYGAYFIGSLILYLSSVGVGYDILNKIGFKKGIIYGLMLSIVGALLMIPAVNSGQYGFILGAFFIIALGFSLQQTAANPFAIALGDPATGSHRLSLAGGVNSFGTTVGPIIVTLVLFGTVVASEDTVKNASIGSINNLYIILAGVFLLVAGIFAVSKMPRVTSNEGFENPKKATKSMLGITLLIIVLAIIGKFVDTEHMVASMMGNKDGLSEAALLHKAGEVSKVILLCVALFGVLGILLFSNRVAQKSGEYWGAMKYPQLVLGMVAIFVYVGVEVTIQSNMGALLKTPDFGGLNESQISHYISLYWGSLMIGRWVGAITVFDVKKSTKNILTVVVPFVAFGVILGANYLSGNSVTDILDYAICIAVIVVAFFIANEKPVKTLVILSVLGVIAMLIGLSFTGKVGLYAFISGGLCCSIMWPSIFALSIAGLGKYTSQGSAFLIMMILGGAIIPPFQGGMADIFNIHISYWIPVVCFAYLAFFALKAKGVLKGQGIDIDNVTGGAGH